MTNAGSFSKFDYRVRPSKQIERRLIFEALQVITRLRPQLDYCYLGMGSLAFVDFNLAHRALGIDELISVEKEKFFERAKFNVPFSCISVVPGDIHDVLPTIDLPSKNLIVWLDYDGKLDDSIVDDVGLCARKLKRGSILLATVNAESGLKPNQIKYEAEELTKRLERRRLPAKLEPKHIAGSNYATLIRNVLTQEINSKAAPTIRGNRVSVKQFLYFTYRDNARMCTLGWYFDEPPPSLGTLGQSVVTHMPQFAPGPTPFAIDAPVLTPKEIRHLNTQLPGGGRKRPSSPGLESQLIDEYAKVYRNFPLYYEVSET